MRTLDKDPIYKHARLFLPFTEGAITVVQTQDFSRSRNHGGLVAARQPFFKKATCEGVLFDGASTYVDIGNNGAYDFGTLGTSFSLVLRIKFGVVGTIGVDFQNLIVRGVHDTDGYLLYLNGGAVAIETCQGAASQSTGSVDGTVVAGQWYTICVTYAWGGGVGSARIYVDGAEVTYANQDNMIDPLGNAARVLNLLTHSLVANFANGVCAWARIYNDVLTPAEVLALSNGDRSQDVANLVGWWDLERGWGSIAYDRSVTGADGTIYHGGLVSAQRWYNPVGSGEIVADFEGVGDYIQYAADGSTLGLTDFTFAFWARMTLDTLGGRFMGYEGWAANNQWLVYHDAAGLVVFATYFGGLQYNALVAISMSDKYHHIAGTYTSGGNQILFVDGQPVHSVTGGVGAFTNASALRLSTAAPNAFPGRIGRPSLLDAVLTPSQVKELFNRERHLVGI